MCAYCLNFEMVLSIARGFWCQHLLVMDFPSGTFFSGAIVSVSWLHIFSALGFIGA